MPHAVLVLNPSWVLELFSHGLKTTGESARLVRTDIRSTQIIFSLLDQLAVDSQQIADLLKDGDHGDYWVKDGLPDDAVVSGVERRSEEAGADLCIMVDSASFPLQDEPKWLPPPTVFSKEANDGP